MTSDITYEILKPSILFEKKPLSCLGASDGLDPVLGTVCLQDKCE